MSRSSIAWFDKVSAVWLNSLYMCRMPQLVPFCSNTSASRKQSECRPSKLSERQAQGMIGHICLATSIESTSNITEGSGDRDARSIHARSPAYSATLLRRCSPGSLSPWPLEAPILVHRPRLPRPPRPSQRRFLPSCLVPDSPRRSDISQHSLPDQAPELAPDVVHACLCSARIGAAMDTASPSTASLPKHLSRRTRRHGGTSPECPIPRQTSPPCLRPRLRPSHLAAATRAWHPATAVDRPSSPHRRKQPIPQDIGRHETANPARFGRTCSADPQTAAPQQPSGQSSSEH